MSESEKIAIDTTIQKIIEKIEHFKKISQRKLEAINADNSADNEPIVQFEATQSIENEQVSTSQEQTSSSQPGTSNQQPEKSTHEFLQPRQKFKKINSECDFHLIFIKFMIMFSCFFRLKEQNKLKLIF